MPVFLLVFPALLAAAISFAATPLVRRFALRFGAVDMPGPRKMHLQPTPRLGGLAVVVAVVSVLGLIQVVRITGLHPLDPPRERHEWLGVVRLGVVLQVDEDLRRPGPATARGSFRRRGDRASFRNPARSPRPRLHARCLDRNPRDPSFPLWIVGVTNAFNIVDGLDGLSAGLALIAALSLVGVSS